MEEVELTAEEQAIVDGENIEDEPVVTDEFEVAEEQVEDVKAEESEEPESEELTYEQLAERSEYAERANRGLLKEIKKLRDSNRSYRGQWDELQKRLGSIEEKLEPEEKDDDPEPNREQEPLEWLLWKQKHVTEEVVDEKLKPQTEKLEKEEVEKREAETHRIVGQIAFESEREAFADAKPEEYTEYQAKMSQMRDTQFSLLMERGMTQDQAAAVVLNNEKEFIREAIEEGSNPALKALEVYDAQGFKLSDYEPWVEFNKENESESGEEEQPKEAPLSSRLETVQKGQKASTISDLGGSARKTVITFDQFSEMDPDDPIAAQIYASEKKLAEISISGKTSIS